jgi:hypothetical protein
MLRPSPLDISGLFAGTFTALKQRFGLFVLISLLPFIVSVVLVGAGVAIALSTGLVAYASNARGAAIPVGILIGAVLFVVGIVATVLVQLKSQAMMSVAAYEIAQGARPDVRGLFQRTRGFLPRMVPVILIAFVVVAAIYAVIFTLVFGAVGAASSGGRASSAAALGVVGALALLFVVLVPLAFYVQIKLLYTLPAVAIEQLGGIDGMKRSWGLTRGEFWRTFGYYLLASVAAAAISYVVSFVTQMAMVPMMSGLNRTTSGAEAIGQLAALLPVILLTFLLQMAVQLITVPFLHAYITYMFIDQIRRGEIPAAPAYGYGTPGQGYAPGYPPAPQPQAGPYSAQPPQGYPQQGQGYPQPGQGYGQPGQGYPPPAQYPNPPQQPPQGQWPPTQQGPTG